MNSLERCMAVINHQIPDRVPVIPQDHHVAMRYAGYTHGQFHIDPQKMFDAQIRYMDEFDLDGTLIGADTVCLAEAVGCKIDMCEDQCPRHVAGFITSYDQVKDLEVPDPYKAGRMPVWIEATRLIAEKVGKERLVIARADQGAFSLASMMRGIQDFLVDLTDPNNEEGIHSLLQYCNKVQFRFIEALKEAGAHVVTTGDSISGPAVVSPRIYKKYSNPYEKELSAFCKKLEIPLSIHICGFTDPILSLWVDTGCEIMELDHKTNFELARKASLGRSTLFGNLDTTLLFSGSYDEVYDAASKLLECIMPEGDFILSSGCLMGQNTPIDSVRAMVDAAKNNGIY